MDNLTSVIITTYNRPFSVLRNALNSVLKQTYKNIEIIIVNDNNPENPYNNEIDRGLVSLNDKRIKYIKHGINKGACRARNTGIYNSNGEFIAFLDDDDEWLSRKLEKQIEKFKDKETGMVYCSYYINRNREKILHNKSKETKSFFDELLYRNFIGTLSSIVIRRNVIFDVGLFDPNLPASQDYDLYLRVAKKYKVDFVNEPLLLYHEHENDRITTNPEKKLAARKYIYEKYKNDIKSRPKVNSIKNLHLALSYSQTGQNRLKWKHWLYSTILYPVPTRTYLKSTIKILFNL